MADLSALVAGCVARPIRSVPQCTQSSKVFVAFSGSDYGDRELEPVIGRTNLSETLFERLFKRGPMHKHVMEF
jgi:hypothetical protein